MTLDESPDSHEEDLLPISKESSPLSHTGNLHLLSPLFGVCAGSVKRPTVIVRLSSQID